jgi:serine O-acetyltransferase
MSNAVISPREGESRPESDDPDLSQVVEALCAANEELLQSRPRRRGHYLLPSRQAISQVMDDLRAILFPGHFEARDAAPEDLRYVIGARLVRVRTALTEQVRRGLSFTCAHGHTDGDDCPACGREASRITAQLVSALPRIRAWLGADVRAAFDGDPAAKFIDETLSCYPGITAITAHRIAHELYRRAVPLIPRIIAELAHSTTGIDIHPGAEIGESFFIDHGTGVVIGETCSIGARVRLYQSVTLGARGFPTDDECHPVKSLPRHPVVEDDVTIYAGATILGRITIGKGATIGGNVWLTRSVPAGTRLTQAQLRNDARGESSTAIFPPGSDSTPA